MDYSQIGENKLIGLLQESLKRYRTRAVRSMENSSELDFRWQHLGEIAEMVEELKIKLLEDSPANQEGSVHASVVGSS